MLAGRIRLVALTGLGGCGKDTFADELVAKFGYTKVSFAQPIYDMLNALPYLGHLNSQMDRKMKEADSGFYGRSPRHLLRTLGTEWGRVHVSSDVWIWILEDKLRNGVDINRKLNCFVITDLRFENEREWVEKNGGLVVGIHRGESVVRSSHVSDAGIHKLDLALSNDGTIEEFIAKAGNIDAIAESRRVSMRSYDA